LYSFAQYINWITGESIPYPTNNPYTYDEFTTFTARFYNDTSIAKKVDSLFKASIKKIQKRKNTVNGKVYSEDPTIMTWEIANEPQSAPASWFNDVAKFIKKNAPNQLVTSGIESKLDEQDFINAHGSKYIDYCTSHLWVEK
jgi:mannan endo-1,4-beta-mannosidase